MKNFFGWSGVFAAALFAFAPLRVFADTPADPISRYNLTWNTPSEDSRGSMPLGNGDVGLNVWVEKATGDVLFYISKSDAWSSGMYGSYPLLKLGRVRIHFSFPASASDTTAPFSQTLHLETGEIVIRQNNTTLRIWVDANLPVVRVWAQSQTPVGVRVTVEPWRTMPENGLGTDVFVPVGPFRVAWYYRNPSTPDRPETSNLTFGALVQTQGELQAVSDTHALESHTPLSSFFLSVYPCTAQTDTPAQWMEQLEKRIVYVEHKRPWDTARHNHEAWWKQFWQRSYIHLSGTKEAEAVSQNYALQRFVTACAGRGAFPIKFNGSLFTTDYHRSSRGGFVKEVAGESVPVSADYRKWGGRYWFQNTRAMYYPLLQTGDWDMMVPLFRMYRNMLPANEKQVRQFYNHEGVYFVETAPFWGGIANWTEKTTPNTGTFYYTPILELSALALQYYVYTHDENFVRETLLLLADGGVTFYAHHFGKSDNTPLTIAPANALETYWKTTNPAPDIAGLHRVLTGLLDLPPRLTTAAQRTRWQSLLARLPNLPTGTTPKSKNEMVLLPAEKYGKAGNVENPELYAVFPFRVYGVGKPDLELARRTFAARIYKQDGCWTQNAIQAAYLGDSEQAKHGVMVGFLEKEPLIHKENDLRFPVFFGPNYDYLPDEDQGGNAQTALQAMLLQSDGDKIYLFPAWPHEWNADFRLRAPHHTTVSASLQNGKITRLVVSPPERRKDVVIGPR